MQVLVEGLVPCCARSCAPGGCCVEERCVLDTVVSRVIDTDEFPLETELRMVEFEIRQKGFDPSCITTRYREVGSPCGAPAGGVPCSGTFARLKQFEEFNWTYNAPLVLPFNFLTEPSPEFEFAPALGDVLDFSPAVTGAFDFVEDPPAPTHWETFPGLWSVDVQETTFWNMNLCMIWGAVLGSPVVPTSLTPQANKMADAAGFGIYGRRRQVQTQTKTFPYNGGFRCSLIVVGNGRNVECSGTYLIRNATTATVFASGALPLVDGTYNFGPFPAQSGDLEVTLLADNNCPIVGFGSGGSAGVTALLEVFVP